MTNELLAEFHFLRPYWLVAVIPAILLCLFLLKAKQINSRWQGVIAPHLLLKLIDRQQQKKNSSYLIGLCFAWMLTSLALAGPTWQRLPQPVQQSQSSVVILLDLSPSMLAEDTKPSRLIRARFKLLDFLNMREDGLNALIAYAGEAHIVSPLTDDAETISNLMPAMEPALMPLRGSNIEMAVEKAVAILSDAGLSNGDILAVTDGIDPVAFENIRTQLSATNFRFSALGIGTPEGAPIPTGSGGFERDPNGNIVIPKLNRDEINTLASSLGGTYVDMKTDNADIETLLSRFDNSVLTNETMESGRQFDIWEDKGQWLVLLLLPFIFLSFRRGWLLSLAFIVVVIPEPSYAFGWEDLWQRKDQQAQRSFEQGDNVTASEKFTHPEWQGTAYYKDENYEAAAEKFSQKDSAKAHYNRGNALAKAGKLEAAIEAYDQSLALNKNNDDAIFNRDLVSDILEQQKQQNKGQEQNQQSQDQQEGEKKDQESDSSDNPANDPNQQASQEQEDASDSRESRSNSEQETNLNDEDSEAQEESARELADREQKPQDLSEEQLQQLKEAEQRQKQSGEKSDQESEEELQQMLANMEESNAEQQQSLEQWLRQVPDDPSGLLRRKFDYQHRELRRNYRRGDWVPPENQSYQRW